MAIIEELSNALCAVGRVQMDGDMTIRSFKTRMEDQGFVFLPGGYFLFGERMEETTDMSMPLREVEVIWGVKYGRIEFGFGLDMDDEQGNNIALTVNMIRCDGEFHMEASWPVSMTSLKDMTAATGWYACANNYISCGANTAGILGQIYENEGLHYSNDGTTWEAGAHYHSNPFVDRIL